MECVDDAFQVENGDCWGESGQKVYIHTSRDSASLYSNGILDYSSIDNSLFLFAIYAMTLSKNWRSSLARVGIFFQTNFYSWLVVLYIFLSY